MTESNILLTELGDCRLCDGNFRISILAIAVDFMPDAMQHFRVIDGVATRNDYPCVWTLLEGYGVIAQPMKNALDFRSVFHSKNSVDDSRVFDENAVILKPFRNS